MNTTNHNIATLNEAALDEVQGGLLMTTIMAGTAAVGGLALLAKACVDVYKSVKANKNAK